MSLIFLSHEKPKAIRTHECGTCWEVIKVGQHYNKISFVDDKQVCSFKQHPECYQATKHWRNDDWECYSGERLKRGTDRLY